jgi:hypothetical protein
MNGFTEGPWIAIHPDEWTHTVVTDLHKNLPDGCKNYWAVASINGRRDEAEANLALIAAAPDLLHALQNIENDNGQIPDHAWKVIQDAIAKATTIQ